MNEDEGANELNEKKTFTNLFVLVARWTELYVKLPRRDQTSIVALVNVMYSATLLFRITHKQTYTMYFVVNR